MSVILGILFVAIATSVGWAVRGEWGNWWGETVPGAIAGMAIWAAFGASTDGWQLIAFGAALSIAHTIGGEISYGHIVSYIVSRRSLLDGKRTGPENRSPLYGLLSLFIVGGMIGLFPSAALGLLMTEVGYSLGDLALWGTLAALGAFLFYKLVVTGIGFRLSPPRYDYWAATLGGSLATFAYFHLLAGDAVVVRTLVIGWLGYGIGFSVGGIIHRRACHARSKLDSWKWMEHSVGFFGGLALGTSAALVTGPIEPLELSQTWKFASLLVVAWFVPHLILTDVFQDWTFRAWQPGTAISRSLDEVGPNFKRDGWRRIASRRTFLLFQVISLVSLPIFLLASIRLTELWDGSSWWLFPLAILLVLYVSIGILKFLPVQRDRAKLVTQVTFVVMVAACLLLLHLLQPH